MNFRTDGHADTVTQWTLGSVRARNAARIEFICSYKARCACDSGYDMVILIIGGTYHICLACLRVSRHMAVPLKRAPGAPNNRGRNVCEYVGHNVPAERDSHRETPKQHEMPTLVKD